MAPDSEELCPIRVSHFRRDQKTFLIACLSIVLASFALNPSPTRDAGVSILGFSLPSTCPSYIFFKTPCPGCGMTRSFVATAHGQFHNAFAHHRVGPFFFLFVFLHIPYRLYLFNRGPIPLPRWITFLEQTIPLLFLLAILTNWVFLISGW